MKDNSNTLAVDYLIWQGRISNPTWDLEAWLTDSGGGIHDPTKVANGHYDHLHITVEENHSDAVK